MAANLKYLWALLGMTFKSSVSQRNAVLVRAVLAVITHLMYFPVWIIIFSISPDIMGWTLKHGLYTYALCLVCMGIVSLLAFGLRTIPEQIDHGEFDAYLTLPRSVLLTAALSSSKNSGLGEIIFGLGALIFCKIHFGMSLALLPLFLMMGCTIYASAILIFATCGFWLKQFYASADELYFNFVLMASRPAPIFTGVAKVIALTILPVSLMSRVPVEFVFTHHVSLLIYAAFGIMAYAVLAVSFFHIGLRHYESGSRFGVRG